MNNGYFDDGNRYVVVVLNVAKGNPETDEHMIPTSPHTVRTMCSELMKNHKAMDRTDALRVAGIMAKQNGMRLGDGFPPAFSEMTWGDWREVAQHRKAKDERLFIVKVVDSDITELDIKYRAGRGGGG